MRLTMMKDQTVIWFNSSEKSKGLIEISPKALLLILILSKQFH